MKKILLSLFAAFCVLNANAEDVVLWEDAEGVTVSWGEQNATKQDAGVADDFKAGGKLIVTVASVLDGFDYPQVGFKDSSWGDVISSQLISSAPCELTFTLTDSQIASMKNGFWATGEGAVVTKLVYSYEDSENPVDMTNAIWIGETVFADDDSCWGSNVSVSSSAFENAKAGDVLEFRASVVSDNFFVQPFFGGWGGTVLNSDNSDLFTKNETVISITLDEEMVDSLKAGGLVVQARGCTLNVIALIEGEATPEKPEVTSAIWEDEYTFDESWSGSVKINSDFFADSKAGDKIRFTADPVEPVSWEWGGQLFLKTPQGGWASIANTIAVTKSGTYDVTIADDAMTIQVKLYDESQQVTGEEDVETTMLNELKTYGLIIQGVDAKLTKVELVTTEDETSPTAIASVTEEQTDNAWYTLSGVRVAAPQKGLYIHNGKKLMVK